MIEKVTMINKEYTFVKSLKISCYVMLITIYL